MAMSIFSFVEAQSTFRGSTTNSTAKISNTTADTLNLPVTTNNRIIGIDVLVSRTGGTMAGTVRLYGTTWDSTGTWHALGDTLTLSNAVTNTHKWDLTDNTYSKLYIIQSGGTTVTGYLRAKATAIKN